MMKFYNPDSQFNTYNDKFYYFVTTLILKTKILKKKYFDGTKFLLNPRFFNY